ncbi:GntR family transcriptional regulator [Piscinibacter sakaiensis]|uniref:Transcriptional regulator, GntR family n=1 Tax=Piscinibacter sakaiensis TaxID=1547922 RepID=A0A0K8NYP5_PISS1|nr:GntR family transcriptional regulator [Piscinibacter sakaiensis]GAP35493.1 transcriptional regulator, GntR family [Piscinibacter sakaiensis]
MPDTDPRQAGASVDAIADRILGAIWEHRLPPGTKLVEEKLASAFGVSRTKVRLALARLTHDGVLSTEPNRGTFVGSPSVAQARQVFEARRLIELAMVRELAGTITREGVARLRRNVALEAASRARDDRHATIRLSGEFHLLLAQLGGNAFLQRAMRELCSLTCLVIALYDAPGMPSCPHHEHTEIVDALEAGDGELAARRMAVHLEHIEGTLRLEMPAEVAVDFDALFR